MSKAYQNFLDVLNEKSPYTKSIYRDCLKNFCDFMAIRNCDRIITFEIKALEDKVKEFLSYLINMGKGYSAQNQHLSALQIFFVCNRVNLNFSWIKMFMKKDPEKDKAGDRPYRKQEIARMLKKSDLRARIEMGIMFAGGARIGALPLIRLADLHYLEAPGLYAIDAYPNSKENYWILLTPQVSAWIKEIFPKKAFPADAYLLTGRQDKKKAVSRSTIIYDIQQAAEGAGLRQGKDGDRFDVMLNHGFRKFFRTSLENSGITDQWAERLIGHLADLKRRYSKPTPAEVFENSQYAKAIPALTIDL
jgi:integrase